MVRQHFDIQNGPFFNSAKFGSSHMVHLHEYSSFLSIFVVFIVIF